MIIILNGTTIGETSSSFVYADKAAKVLVFSSDGEDIVSIGQSTNSLTRLLEKSPVAKGDQLVLQFGATDYSVDDMQLILDAYGNEIAMKADIVGVEDGGLDLTGAGTAKVWTYLSANLSATTEVQPP